MDKNKELLSLLTQDCRRTPRQLAAILGESEDEVRQRIAKLENSGAIVKYSAILNDEMLDRDSVHAMIEVKVTPQKSKGFDAIAEEICRYPEVKSVYLISGDFDLAVFIEGKSLRSVSLFVSEKLSAIFLKSTIGAADCRCSHEGFYKQKNQGDSPQRYP